MDGTSSMFQQLMTEMDNVISLYRRHSDNHID